MKSLEAFTMDEASALTEFEEYEALLQTSEKLSETTHVLPFFQRCRNLASLIGSNVSGITLPDTLAFEFDIFGDFCCDLVVGNHSLHHFAFIEFEDAEPNSIFRQQGRKANREWASRFEHGFGQIVDWFYCLADLEKSDVFERRFGSRTITYGGILVIGRDHQFEPGEERRLKWRSNHIVVDSRPIICLTYDQLARWFAQQLRRFKEHPKPRKRKK